MSAVGVVGLGAMGSAMSARLIEAGCRVHGVDVDSERVSLFARAGGIPDSLVGLSSHCHVVITSLPSAAAAAAVLGKGSPLYSGAGGIVLETSTLAPAEKVQLAEDAAEAGWVLLDCPMSGTSQQAIEGDLVAYLSGEPSAMDRAEPVLRHITRGIHRVGGVGDGSTVKLIANHLVAIHNVAAAEALALAEAAGLDIASTLAAVADGAGSSRMLQVRGPLMAEGRYTPATMRIELFMKDLGLIAELRDETGASTPLLDDAARIYEEALAAGLGDADTASVFTLLRMRESPRP